MSATSEERGVRDDHDIDKTQDAERRRWARKLGVSVDQLRAAVDAVGSNAEAVERYLRDRAESSRSASS